MVADVSFTLRMHGLVDDVGISENRVRRIHSQARQPNWPTVLVKQRLDDFQRRVVEHVLRAASVRRRFATCRLRTSSCRSLQPHWNQWDANAVELTLAYQQLSDDDG
jgi:hypothetical protein